MLVTVDVPELVGVDDVVVSVVVCEELRDEVKLLLGEVDIVVVPDDDTVAVKVEEIVVVMVDVKLVVGVLR